MAASMWRMNGVWKRRAGVLLLCALLLCDGVTCQDDTTANITDDPAAGAPEATTSTPDATTAGAVGSTVHAGGAFLTSTQLSFTLVNVAINQNRPASGTTAAPSGEKEVVTSCVKLPELKDMPRVSFPAKSADCEEAKRIIHENPPAWCKEHGCDLKLYQDGEILYAGSNDGRMRCRMHAPVNSYIRFKIPGFHADGVDLSTLTNMFHNDPLQGKLMRPTSSPPPSSSSDSSVFVGVLVSGLLAAAAITAGYCKCQRRSDSKGVKLAEEAYPVDQENQGNTLVSVAPLNPPPETPEKPSVNGESPEAVKTEPTPPTNGHSTTNTADTEM